MAEASSPEAFDADEVASAESAPEPSASDPPRRRPRFGASPVSAWWRVATIVLVLALAIVGVTLASLAASSRTETLTKVEWFNYTVESSQDSVSNSTPMNHGTNFCGPSDAVTTPIFSLVWATASGRPVPLVRISALEDPKNPHVVNLYVAANQSSGGTSFLSPSPDPCDSVWTLAVTSTLPETTEAVATLTYNYTTTVAWPSQFS